MHVTYNSEVRVFTKDKPFTIGNDKGRIRQRRMIANIIANIAADGIINLAIEGAVFTLPHHYILHGRHTALTCTSSH